MLSLPLLAITSIDSWHVWGIQELYLLEVTSFKMLDQNRELHLVSSDMEKAFQRVGHHIILKALRCFGVHEIMILAIQHYTLMGFSYVEFNGHKGTLITIKMGCGQGDYLSSTLFLVATETLNHFWTQHP